MEETPLKPQTDEVIENTAEISANPSMGSARSTGGVAEKDFYTPQEVDRLSPSQLDDPAILKTIIHSMTQWR